MPPSYSPKSHFRMVLPFAPRYRFPFCNVPIKIKIPLPVGLNYFEVPFICAYVSDVEVIPTSTETVKQNKTELTDNMTLAMKPVYSVYMHIP